MGSNYLIAWCILTHTFLRPNPMRLYVVFALLCALAGSAPAEQVLYCAGTVRYPSGAPAVGVQVAYYPGHHDGAGQDAQVKTDTNGRYAIIGPKDEAIYWGIIVETNTILARAVPENMAAVRHCHMTTTNVDLTLQPALTLSGSIKNTEGAPIGGAEVQFAFTSARSTRLLEPAKANESGEFSMPALPQGYEYEVWRVSARGYGSVWTNVIAADTQTNRYHLPPLVLQKADRMLAGRVIMDGKWAPGAKVTFGGKGQPQGTNASTITDVEGRFKFGEVCEGAVHVAAYKFVSSAEHLARYESDSVGSVFQAGDTNVLLVIRDQSQRNVR
jgi:hypothetical protein